MVRSWKGEDEDFQEADRRRTVKNAEAMMEEGLLEDPLHLHTLLQKKGRGGQNRHVVETYERKGCSCPSLPQRLTGDKLKAILRELTLNFESIHLALTSVLLLFVDT